MVSPWRGALAADRARGMEKGWSWWRTLALVAALLLGGTLVVLSGVLQRLAPWLSPPEQWRAERVAEMSLAPDPLVDLQEQVIRLNAENAVLRRRLRDYAAIAGEGGFEAVLPVLRRVRVLARSNRSSQRYLTINAGTYDGVEVGNAVLAGWSLVGVIAGEEPGRALVRLVTDPDSRIPAHLVKDDDDDAVALALGVAVGSGARGEMQLDLVEDRPDLTVRAGMMVVTAGDPGTIAPGLVLGEVISAELPEDSDHWQITVRPLRRGDLESSLVVLRSPAPALGDTFSD